MELNYIAFAIPAFFLFVLIEYAIAFKRSKAHYFSYENSVSNISIGLAERLLDLFIAGGFYDVFNYLYEHYRLFTFTNNALVWVAMLLFTDLVWYWYHRLGHEVNLLWAGHIVHHQSEDFNYTVSARITVLQALARNVFWCLLPLAGFKPELASTILLVHGAYSFFTHTQLVKRVKWLEYIFITPSLHGVHHASDQKYLDKNYGDIFVFWDKLFGTFATEDTAPAYGLTHPLKSHSFLWQHFHYYLELVAAMRGRKSFGGKLRILFGNPGTLDQRIRPVLENRFLPGRKFERPGHQRFRTYVNVQVTIAAVLVFAVTLFFGRLPGLEKGAALLIVILTLVNCGALLEQRRWIYELEIARLLLLSLYGCLLLQNVVLLIPIVALIAMLGQMRSLKSHYLNYLYNK